MYFRAIAEEGNLSRASKKLCIQQPSLSIQLKKFEDQIGQQLFERRNRGLHLTHAGRLVLKYAHEIYNTSQELESILSEKDLKYKSKINIGTLDNVPKDLVSSIIGHILKHHSCEVAVFEKEGPNLMSDLENHLIDLVVTNYPLIREKTQKIYTQKLLSFEVFAYTSIKNKQLVKNFPKSLENESIILPTFHSKLRQDIESYFYKNKIKTNLVVQTQDTSIQKTLAVQGVGVIFESQFAVKNLLKNNQLIELGKLKNVKEEYYLSSTEKIVSHPIVEDLLNNYTI